MLLAFIVLIIIIIYFMMFKKETFVKFDEKILFGIDKKKDNLYKVNLRLSKLEHLDKVYESIKNKHTEKKPEETKYKDMVLDISCVPKKSTFIPQDLGYDQYSSLGFTKDKHLKNYEFKNLIDHLFKKKME